MIKAFIFDLGSVCFHIDWLKISEEMENKFNICTLVKSKGTKEQIDCYNQALEGKRSAEDFFRLLSGKEDVEEIINYYKKMYRKYRSENKEITELIKKLREKFKVVCLTDTHSFHFETYTEYFDNFDEVFASFQIGSIKADKKIFEKVRKKLGLKPEELVFIDDSDKNIENARSLGINAIRFENNKQLIEDLKKLKLV